MTGCNPADAGQASVPDLLEGLLLRHARDRPWAPAVRAHDVDLTWSELRQRVAQSVGGLSALGVRPGDRVAVRTGNSGAFVVAALACVWLGAIFVPMSPEDPERRVRSLLIDCSPRLSVTAGTADRGRFRNPPEVAWCQLLSGREITSAPPREPSEDAYIIYTSGTTGAPKGVRIPRSAMAWAIDTTAEMIGLGVSSRALCVSSFHFDGSYASLFTTLWAGGTVVIPRRSDLVFVKRFYRALREDGIDHTSFSPSYLRLLLRSREAESLAGSRLATLALGGEECLAEDLRRLRAFHPAVRVFNIYGPTETTIQVTSFPVDEAAVLDGRIPIGGPHRGVSFHLVDDAGSVLRGGNVTGELHIGGRQLMSGYWNDDRLSRAVLDDGLVPGTRLYRTGDLVHRAADGRYFYVSRVDDVVKRQGVRISLVELTAALRRLGGVSAAVCLPVDLDGSLGVAAVVETALDVPPGQLRAALAAVLPETMIPDQISTTRTLPLNTSGKVDRSAVLAEFGWRSWADRTVPESV